MPYRKKSVPFYRDIVERAFKLKNDEKIVIKCSDKAEMRRIQYNLVCERRLILNETPEYIDMKLKIQLNTNNMFAVIMSLVQIMRNYKVFFVSGDKETVLETGFKENETQRNIKNMAVDGFTVNEITAILGRKLTEIEKTTITNTN